MSAIEISRLAAGDAALACALFDMMQAELGEKPFQASRDYVAHLLERDDFVVLAAVSEGAPVGGLTAHLLPMTRSDATELLIYDIAVAPAHQRRGIGRRLVEAALRLAEDAGIGTTWVPVDNDDGYALDFYRAIGGSPAAVTIFTLE